MCRGQRTSERTEETCNCVPPRVLFKRTPQPAISNSTAFLALMRPVRSVQLWLSSNLLRGGISTRFSKLPSETSQFFFPPIFPLRSEPALHLERIMQSIPTFRASLLQPQALTGIHLSLPRVSSTVVAQSSKFTPATAASTSEG